MYDNYIIHKNKSYFDVDQRKINHFDIFVNFKNKFSNIILTLYTARKP